MPLRRNSRTSLSRDDTAGSIRASGLAIIGYEANALRRARESCGADSWPIRERSPKLWGIIVAAIEKHARGDDEALAHAGSSRGCAALVWRSAASMRSAMGRRRNADRHIRL